MWSDAEAVRFHINEGLTSVVKATMVNPEFAVFCRNIEADDT